MVGGISVLIVTGAGREVWVTVGASVGVVAPAFSTAAGVLVEGASTSLPPQAVRMKIKMKKHSRDRRLKFAL
jgi:hypothetical protein